MATIVGTAGDDILAGTAAADEIYGLGGNDTIQGGPGSPNTLVGGTGNDDYYVETVGDSIVESLSEGNDRVLTSLASFTLPSSVEQLLYTGSSNFVGVGNDDDNVILGGNGDDTLDGGLGRDTLAGGQGNDILIGGSGFANQLQGGVGNDVYYVSAAGDSIVEFAGEGTDQVRTSLSAYRLAANVEQLIFVGTGNFSGIGNDADNLIAGGSGDDVLDGGLGGDSLSGGAGDDILIGGNGAANVLVGGAGRDIYFVTAAGDTVVENFGEGNDQVRTNLASYNLPSYVEQLIFTGVGDFRGIGNTQDNLIAGGNGNDMLSGGLGADTLIGGDGNDTLDGGTGLANTMIGGAGDDSYIVQLAGDSIVEEAGGGIDSIYTNLASYTLRADLEKLIYIGVDSFSGVGNALDNVLIGGNGEDHLLGGDGNDTVIGGAGHDLLEGGSGNNTLIGGIGNDIYLVVSTGDTIVELADGGTDEVQVFANRFVVPYAVERLIFTGTGAFDGSGASVLIRGGAGNDRLEGSGRLDGLGGNDILVGGSINWGGRATTAIISAATRVTTGIRANMFSTPGSLNSRTRDMIRSSRRATIHWNPPSRS